MEHNRKQKLLMIVALIMGIVSLSVGFAAFSTTLNISSTASVTPDFDTFSVKFSSNKDSLVTDAIEPYEKTANTTASNAVIDNGVNPTISNISVTFKAPGDYVVYEVYVRNEGEYLAYLNNINFIGNKTCIAETETTDSLVQNACESISIGVRLGDTTYTENTSFNNRTLSSKTGEVMYIVLEYLGDGPMVDGPFRISFPSVSLVYSTIDNSSMDGNVVRVVSGDINTPGSVVAIGNEQFYVFDKENGNVKLLSMYNLRVGNSVDEEWNVTPLTNTTGIQDSEARGYVEGEIPFIGTTAFSNTNSTYSGSIVEGYVNNYKTYLTNMGADISSARLITKAELEKLGCNEDDYSCSDAPSWVYSTSYWSGSARDTDFVWIVNSFATFDGDYYSDDIPHGVRPVIEISLSEF